MSKHCCKDMFSSKSSPIWLQFCSGSCKNPTHKWTVIIIVIIFSIFSDSHLLKHSVTVAAGAGPNIRSAQKEGEKQQNKTKILKFEFTSSHCPVHLRQKNVLFQLQRGAAGSKKGVMFSLVKQ